MSQQLVLKHHDEITEGWVDNDNRLRSGVKVQLKGDDRWWTIDSVSAQMINMHDSHDSDNWYKKDWLHKIGNR